jgi:hypothetical protein
VRVLRIAHQHMSEPATILFLRECLNQIVVIMLDQSPSKIGHFERNCAEESLKLAVSIIVTLLKNGETYCFDTLVQLFNKKRAFYKGVKTYWSTLPGAPEVRARAGRRRARSTTTRQRRPRRMPLVVLHT